MTITLQAVNELIASLENAGELSIREQKFLKLAKAYQQLAAENVAIREQSEEVYAAGYNHGHLNTVDGIAYAGCVKDDFYGLALQVMAEVETPATDRIVAGIKADGVEQFASYISLYNSNDERHAIDFAKQLRDGVNHD
ncbi:hypothetical protein [Klebsiella pneumoniae]|uniref:hypothetical protein n=1 Tax=Klebsiella pneumoniae TaxID=573 RepID=UPI003A4E17E0